MHKKQEIGPNLVSSHRILDSIIVSVVVVAVIESQGTSKYSLD